ncbi:hypothetical protein G9A89_008439 [Geosiphon pyriformis]|nr:hypothetical protein G9A89_008439 [Geosiphon pyriformis]
MDSFSVPSKEDQPHHKRKRCKCGDEIALSEASIILSFDQPLPPYRINANHARYNLATKLLSVMTPELVPCDPIRDE